MKKILAVGIVLAVALALCACGKPTLQDYVDKADKYVLANAPALQPESSDYEFFPVYFDDLKSYTILMSVNKLEVKDRLQAAWADGASNMTEEMKTEALNKAYAELDGNTALIEAEFDKIRGPVQEVFVDCETPVRVVTTYTDCNGQVTDYE